MDVSIIVVTYNSTPVLRPCLEALRHQRLDGDCEIIVVDNASSDGTPEIIARDFPWVHLYAGTENLGYSKGVNVGIRRARGRFFLILNPDTVVREDSVQNLADFMEKTADAGIVGPRLVFSDGNVQLSCRRFYTLRVLLFRRTPLGRVFRKSRAVREHLMMDFDHESTVVVDWVLGAAMFVRREAVESVGLMDERFFLYFEDVDWCYRMKQYGLRVYYCAESVIRHGHQRESAQSVLNRPFISHLVSMVRYYEKWNVLVYFLKRYRELVKFLLFVLIDLVAFNAAFLSAYYLRLALDNVLTNPIFPISAYERFVFFENLLFVFTYAALGMYRIRRETRSADELFDIGRAIVVASVVLMTSTYLGQIRTYSRMVVAFVVPFAIVYDWLLRTLLRRIHRRLLALKVDLKRACIVGPRVEARALEGRLLDDDTLGIDVVGLVDTEDRNEGILTGSLGRVEDIERIVERHRVQEVIVLPHAVDDEVLVELVAMARRRVVDIKILTDYAGIVFHKARITYLQGRPVISYGRDTRYALDRGVKRALDVLTAAVLVLVSAPLCMLYSLFALARGGRPFAFVDRVGSEGEPFTLPLAGSSDTHGPSDIVNLPLFWLVLAGKMSFVGPYPTAPDTAQTFPEAARFRFDMRPGVTGPWRARGRKSMPVEELLVQDAGYVRNWSLFDDAKIALSTLPQILAGRNRVLRIADAAEPAAEGSIQK